MVEKKTAELSAPEPKKAKPGGRPFPKGVSGNPGGQSKEKRAFLERLKSDDADAVYAAFMLLVRDGNAPAVLRAVEYLAGRPKNADEDNAAIREGLTVVVHSLATKAVKK